MTASGWLPGGRRDRLPLQAVFVQLVLDELDAWGSDALADCECVPQVHGGVGRVVGEETQADCLCGYRPAGL
jgi:hypothetical protein